MKSDSFCDRRKFIYKKVKEIAVLLNNSDTANKLAAQLNCDWRNARTWKYIWKKNFFSQEGSIKGSNPVKPRFCKFRNILIQDYHVALSEIKNHITNSASFNIFLENRKLETHKTFFRYIWRTGTILFVFLYLKVYRILKYLFVNDFWWSVRFAFYFVLTKDSVK